MGGIKVLKMPSRRRWKLGAWGDPTAWFRFNNPSVDICWYGFASGTPKKVKPIPPIPYRFQWWMSHWEKQDIVFSKSRWWTNLDTNVNSGPKDFAHTDWEKVPSNGKKLNADADIKNQVLVCQSQGTCFNPQGCWLSYSLVRPGNWKEPVQEVHHINERGMFGNHMQFPERNHMHSPLSADTTAGISILTVITSWNSDWFNTYERKFKWKRNKPVVYTYMLHCIYVYIILIGIYIYIYVYIYIHIHDIYMSLEEEKNNTLYYDVYMC